MLGKRKINILLMLLALILPNLLFGASINTSGAENVLDSIKVALFAVAGITITVLIAYVSFKVMHQGRPIDEMTKIIVGGALLASASAVGGVFASFIQ
ncbi:TrbC/VirB2 family protein [Aliarcobacter butzleri]|uniref:TrbC/VirB2 family protein n=1 Tax=Aliarcobacter butzleri TaxID=28197 RepID=UPI001EDC79B4|nr:TrbC/VirB2 family protein [Aliarcobacter butzleri]MCG3667480.1 TrbC/VirB2 family protein [Aliarcobacter butzleri]MCG3703766.1 TrbC/VirB2 family protein [Aliarcobacter butzleri]MDN5112931.1 TrbC/VirB2 family protein [Aliarcobacter butzleri]